MHVCARACVYECVSVLLDEMRRPEPHACHCSQAQADAVATVCAVETQTNIDKYLKAKAN